MRTLGFVFLLLFAAIGFITTAYAVAVFLGKDKAGRKAQKYTDNCKRVKVGMTLKQANDIMEDFSGRESCIRTSFDNDSVKRYFLVYPERFGASSAPTIYFDPTTQIVMKVYCGDGG